MAFQLQVVSALTPPGQCYPATWRQALTAIAQNLIITGLGALNSFNYGPTQPATDLQDRPWIKTDALFRFIGIYTFTQGSWQPAAPPILPGTILDLFGLSSSVVAPYYICTGQVINGPIGGSLTTPNLQGLTRIGAGTNPTTGTNFAYGTIVGEEKHTQTLAELVAHDHGPSGGGAFETNNSAGITITAGGAPFGSVNDRTSMTGGGTAFNVIQPSIALWPIIFWP